MDISVFCLKVRGEDSLLFKHSYLGGFTGEPDVTVRFGVVPEDLDSSTYMSNFLVSTGDSLLMKINGVAKYLITGGTEIVVEPEKDADLDDVVTFIYGSALGTILHQRGIIPLHGSAIATEKGAVIFVGAQGVGKSTLVAGLSKRGWSVMADDVCAVVREREDYVLCPGFTRSKLTEDSYRKVFGETLPSQHDLPILKKYLSPAFKSEKCSPVRAIYHLIADNEGISSSLVKGAQRMQILLENTYRPSVQKLYMNASDVFAKYAELSKKIPIYQISRSTTFDDFDDFLTFVEKEALE